MAILKVNSNFGEITYDSDEYEVMSTVEEFTWLKYIGTSTKPIQPIGLKDYTYMFRSRQDLETLDLSHWDMSEVIIINAMFIGCENLKEIIGIEDWNLSKIEEKIHVFRYCFNLISLPKWHEDVEYDLFMQKFKKK